MSQNLLFIFLLFVLFLFFLFCSFLFCFLGSLRGHAHLCRFLSFKLLKQLLSSFFCSQVMFRYHLSDFIQQGFPRWYLRYNQVTFTISYPDACTSTFPKVPWMSLVFYSSKKAKILATICYLNHVCVV